MKPSIKVPVLFHVVPDPNNPNRPIQPWPVVNRGNAINRVQKILKGNHVTGIPTHWPKIYYGQTRANLNLNRTLRNTNVADLPDGAYLYLIEYSPASDVYHKSFVRVLDKLESGSRHFQLPTRNQGRVIVAAGELSKKGSQIIFNLESGTYTRNLMNKTRQYMGEANYIKLVKNALRTNRPVSITNVKNILVPEIPGSLQNLLARGNLSFYHGTPTNKTRNRVLANLRKAGLSVNSASNLIRKLVEGEKTSSPPATLGKRTRNNKKNGGVVRRSGRGPPVPRA
jgi:hypothetical protein